MRKRWKPKVPIKATRSGVLYVPYWAYALPPWRLRQIAAEVIKQARQVKRGTVVPCTDLTIRTI